MVIKIKGRLVISCPFDFHGCWYCICLHQGESCCMKPLERTLKFLIENGGQC